MSLPNVNASIRDGGIGLLPRGTDGVQAKIGVCTAGVVGRIYSFSSPGQVVATLGRGPLVDAILDSFAAKAKTIHAVRTTGSVAGGWRPQRMTAVNVTMTPALTSGGPSRTAVAMRMAGDSATLRLKVTQPGMGGYANGGAGDLLSFVYSLDAGATWSDEIEVPRQTNATIVQTADGDEFWVAFVCDTSPGFKVDDLFVFQWADSNRLATVRVEGGLGRPALLARVTVAGTVTSDSGGDVELQVSVDGGFTWTSEVEVTSSGTATFALASGLTAVLQMRQAAYAEGDYIGMEFWSHPTGWTSKDHVNLTGTPDRDTELAVQITSTGARGVARFRWSLDAGRNWSAIYLVPANGTVPSTHAFYLATGLNLTFANVTFTAGEQWTCFTQAPRLAITDITNNLETGPLDKLLNSTITWNFVHIVGGTDSAIWVAVDALLQAWETASAPKFVSAMVERPWEHLSILEYVEDVEQEMEDFVSAMGRVWVSACVARFSHPREGMRIIRNGAAILAGMLSGNPIQRSVADATYCPMPLVDDLIDDYTDAMAERLDGAKCLAIRALSFDADGIRYYAVRDRTAALSTSDFKKISWRRVMDKMVRSVRLAMLTNLHMEAPVDDEGELTASAAAALRQRGVDVLDKMVFDKELSPSTLNDIVIPEGQNILAAEEIQIECYGVPVGHLETITVTFGFKNPFTA